MWLLVLAYSLIHFSVVSSNLDACSRSVNEFCPLQPNLNFTDNEESLRAACAAFVGNAVCRSFLAGHCVGREIFKPGELDGIMQLTNDICVNKSNELRTMTVEAMPCIKLEYYESNCTHGEEELLRRYYQHVASYAPLFPQITDCILLGAMDERTKSICVGLNIFTVWFLIVGSLMYATEKSASKSSYVIVICIFLILLLFTLIMDIYYVLKKRRINRLSRSQPVIYTVNGGFHLESP